MVVTTNTTNNNTFWSGIAAPTFHKMKTIYIQLVLILIVFCGLVKTAPAHDPGLSFTKVNITDTEIIIETSYSSEDIKSLIPSKKAQMTDQQELNTKQPNLSKLISSGINLGSDGKLLKAKTVDIFVKDNESVNANLTFEKPNETKVDLTISLIKKLQRGHRQHLLINNGKESTQKILSSKSPSITITLSETNNPNVFGQYFNHGVWHIWIGFDHILFLLTLLLPLVLIFQRGRWIGVEKLTPVLIDTLKIVTAFTLAHSITLGLATFQIIQIPVKIIEPLIALSVIIAAINNLKPLLSYSRWLMAFVFGLIHGFGFATVLRDLGLSTDQALISLLGFNLGVEIGQLVIVLLALPLAYIVRHSLFYRRGVFQGGSISSAMLASVWLIQRIG